MESDPSANRKRFLSLKLLEILSGLLALVLVTWEVFYVPRETWDAAREAFLQPWDFLASAGEHFNAVMRRLLLFATVAFNLGVTFIHVLSARRAWEHWPRAFLWMRLAVAFAATALLLLPWVWHVPSGAEAGFAWRHLPVAAFSLIALMGFLTLINLRNSAPAAFDAWRASCGGDIRVAAVLLFIRLLPMPRRFRKKLRLLYERRCLKNRPSGRRRVSRPWAPPLAFFFGMLVCVFVSALLLLAPNATQPGVALGCVDAVFTASSAMAITGLSCVDLTSVFTPLGKAVILVDVQIGGLGVMTFTYFVFLLVGKRLAMRDGMNLSVLMDQDSVAESKRLVSVVIRVTLVLELLGMVLLSAVWGLFPGEGTPDPSQWTTSLFLAVSSFCNAGILPRGAAACVASHFPTQCVMIFLVFAGTLGFGVYSELIRRTQRHLARRHNPLPWSAHAWLAWRASLVVIAAGAVVLGLLGIFEPSSAQGQGFAGAAQSFATGLWNAVGRSAGFTVADIADYGVVYKLFLCLLMFIGGNPAGMCGGVYAPVFALCLLETYRVLRGQEDVVLHRRRIARNTVERAMATVLISVLWISFTTMILLLLEPSIAGRADGVLQIFFEEVSAYTTTGYSLGVTGELGGVSKMVLSLNMIFGRVGMFTFLMIFIGHRESPPGRYPVTRLPLS